MLLRLSGDIVIEDLWNHSAESVTELRSLLTRGVEALSERQRKDFYEVENGFRVFYIHLCPNGKVLLLAIWSKDSLPTAAPAASQFQVAAEY
ncbi:MAG: hypothetical protein ACRD3O_10350 [Terriglobia bacterium]